MRALTMALAVTAVAMTAAPALADARDSLAAAAFAAPTVPVALGELAAAQAAAEATLASAPGDHDAKVYRAMVIGYRAKLTKSRTGAMEARRLFESLAAAYPNDPQSQALIGGWHLDAIDAGAVARTVLGAKRAVGVAAIDRAAALGRSSGAMYPALAAMMHARLDPGDLAAARAFAEVALAAPTPTAVDRLMQRDVAGLLVPLRAGDGKAAAALARKMLPFGRIL